MPKPLKSSLAYISNKVVTASSRACLLVGVFACKPAKQARVRAVEHRGYLLVEVPCLAAIREQRAHGGFINFHFGAESYVCVKDVSELPHPGCREGDPALYVLYL